MNRTAMLALLLIGGAVLGPARESLAQHLSISFGHHHGWHHHHHCWDPWFWGPHYDLVYVVPPPRPRVVYVEPAVKNLRPDAPRTSAPSSWNAANAERPAEYRTLQIWNGAGRKIPVAFLVNAQQVELADGQSHSFHGGGTRVVEFDRGGNFGTARYELTGGQYEFIITSRGWDLVPKADSTTPISLRPIVRKNALPADVR
jgi:hypothetical protein